MTEQRFTFDTWAEDYDRHRPGYPDALFDDLAGLGARDRPILEIGCGTGKATEGLVRLGRPIFAVEPGAAMIEQARRRVGSAPVRFAHSTFEDWAPPEGLGDGGPFGLIACAQAWHWVDAAIGFPKAAGLLAPDGVLALFGNENGELPPAVRAVVVDFYRRRQPVSGIRHGGHAYGPDEFIDRQLRATPAFKPAEHRVYHRTITYTPESYTALTATYSDVQMQPPEHRAEILAGLHQALAALGPSFEVEVDTHLYWAWPKR